MAETNTTIDETSTVPEALAATSLYDLLRTAAGDAGQTVIEYRTPDARTDLTVGQLLSRAEHVAAGLRARGIREGDVISAQLSNRPEATVLQLAAVILGATLAPIVPVFGPRDVAAVLQDARPALFVTERGWGKFDYLAGLDSLPAGLLPETVVVGGAPGRVDWDDLEGTAERVSDLPALDPARPCLIIYTSGSTGMPKGVVHTVGSIFAEVLDFDYRAHGDSDRDVYLQGSAAGHIGGYMFPWRAIRYRMKTIVMDGWNAALACRLVTEERVTAMVTTPFHSVSMFDTADRDASVDLSSLAMMMTGGAPVGPALVERADRYGVNIVRAYGMSEHPTVAIGDWRDPLEIRASTDGYLTGDNRIRLLDDDDRDVLDGDLGEVVVRGPEQFAGYTNVPREEAFTADGWYRTGDIGRYVDGRLTILDRKKNIIIRGGENLSATEIEDIVATHAAVAEVGVVGVPDERYGERACAFVVLNDGHGLTLDDLRDHFVGQGAAKQKIPEVLRFVDALPRTGTGKLRKAELLKLLEDG
ncbi:AMP-binding protein [Microbacterium sp. No. 7]|uniref:AMP-binding protein n=1 Tax=Microbacterium sp. No. 7 TaxID=1714373 RepID=UPI0006ECE947|nr:AMP-binding protein [Microbacterium sp. No. 7]ALJ18854.1 hypothetical protein AOA12_02575 [Microbacterium sp. No. 7]